MQQSRFDQWLRKTVAYETLVFTYQIPEGEDGGKAEAVPEGDSMKFKHAWRFDSENHAMSFIDKCRQQNLLFGCDVVTKNNKLARFVAKPSRSVTFLLLWLLIILAFSVTAGQWLFTAMQTPEFQEQFKLFVEEVQKLIS